MPFSIHAPAACGRRAGCPCHIYSARRAFPVRLQSTGRRRGIRPSCWHTERRYALCRGTRRGISGPPNALYTQVSLQYAAAALRHGPRRASARTRLMRWDAARFFALARRSVYPGRTPICSRSPPAQPAQSKRTHAAYAPGCSAGFDTGPGALCTQAAPRYAAAALRHGPRRASARTRLMRRDAARALTLGPAQKRRPYAGKPAPPCRSFSIHGPACRARPYSGKRTRRIFYRPSLAL